MPQSPEDRLAGAAENLAHAATNLCYRVGEIDRSLGWIWIVLFVTMISSCGTATELAEIKQAIEQRWDTEDQNQPAETNPATSSTAAAERSPPLAYCTVQSRETTSATAASRQFKA